MRNTGLTEEQIKHMVEKLHGDLIKDGDKHRRAMFELNEFNSASSEMMLLIVCADVYPIILEIPGQIAPGDRWMR